MQKNSLDIMRKVILAIFTCLFVMTLGFTIYNMLWHGMGIAKNDTVAGTLAYLYLIVTASYFGVISLGLYLRRRWIIWLNFIYFVLLILTLFNVERIIFCNEHFDISIKDIPAILAIMGLPIIVTIMLYKLKRILK